MPFQCFLMINMNSLPMIIGITKIVLCLYIFLSGRLSEPANGFVIVFFYAFSVEVPITDGVLSFSISLERGFHIPLERLVKILRNSASSHVGLGQRKFRFSKSCIGSLSQPTQGL